LNTNVFYLDAINSESKKEIYLCTYQYKKKVAIFFYGGIAKDQITSIITGLKGINQNRKIFDIGLQKDSIYTKFSDENYWF